MSPQENRKKIEERAYQLWVEAGRPEGHALDYWLQAEREVSPAEGAPAKARKPRAKRSTEAGARPRSAKVTPIKESRSASGK